MIGGSIGALFGSLMGLGATAYGVTGIPGYLTINNYLMYTVMLLIAAGIAFALTTVIWEGEPADDAAPVEGNVADAPAVEEKIEEPVGDITLVTPVEGNVIARENIPDPTFASGVLGDGVGIEPTVGAVYAPCDGIISAVTETKHAVGISGARDMELLIHVGVDTVNMKGEGFEVFVKEGQKVKTGDKLITFDIEKIKAAGYPTTTAVLLTNSDDYDSVTPTLGAKKVGEDLIVVK